MSLAHFVRDEVARARRTPANTLSSDLAGMNPPQHVLDELLAVIDSSRPIVESATRTTLTRGRLVYPAVDTSPVVGVQSGGEKTEAGNTTLSLDDETVDAEVFVGGGDVSWQGLNWSSPDTVDLWFRYVAADYALKTEQAAATAITEAGFANVVSSPIDSTPTAAEILDALVEGSLATNGADTIYAAPDFGIVLASLVTPTLPFPRVIVSRGLDPGVAVIGRAASLIVGETAGAPVELRKIEPSIGGLEVGLIGAFAAAASDPDAFALLTAAS